MNLSSEIASSVDPRTDRDKAVRILAKTLFRELTSSGYEPRQIVTLSTELLGLVTSSMAGPDDPPGKPAP